MEREASIERRVREHQKAIEKAGYRPMYIALQGSQNYQLDYSGSDVDTKAMVLPSFDDVIFNRKLVSTTHVLENNEHCDVKDIRLMFANFKKQNINFLEILFTQWFYVDVRFEDEISELRAMAEEVAHYNPAVAIKCMRGMAYEKYKAMEHPYPSLADKIEKYGYDAKQLHHIIRMREFLERYLDGEPFAQCLVSQQKEYLIAVKQFWLSLDEARTVAQNELAKIDAMKEFNHVEPGVNERTEKKINDILSRIMKKSFAWELIKDAL